MELTLTIYYEAYLEDSKIEKKTCKSVDYDPTYEDFESFAKFYDFKDFKSYLRFYIDDDEETLKEALENADKKSLYDMELDVKYGCDDKKAFEEFLVREHQQELLETVFEDI